MVKLRSEPVFEMIKRVLLVESADNPPSGLGQIAKKHGLQVATANTVDTAISIFISDRQINLVVVDIVLPGRRSGLIVANAVVAERRSIGVILMAGDENLEPNACDATPFGGLLLRPFNEHEFAAKLEGAWWPSRSPADEEPGRAHCIETRFSSRNRQKGRA